MKTSILFVLLVLFLRRVDTAAITINLYGTVTASKINVNIASEQSVYVDEADGADDALVNRVETPAAARSYDDLLKMYRDIVCERPWDHRAAADAMKCSCKYNNIHIKGRSISQ